MFIGQNMTSQTKEMVQSIFGQEPCSKLFWHRWWMSRLTAAGFGCMSSLTGALSAKEGGHRVIRIGVIWSAFVSKGYSIDSTSFQKRFGYEIHKNVIDSWSKDYLHRVSMTSPKVTPPHDNKFVSYVYKGFMIHEHSLIRFNNKGLLYHHLWLEGRCNPMIFVYLFADFSFRCTIT